MDQYKTVVILTPGFSANEADTTCLPFLQDYALAFKRLYPNINLKIISFQYPFKPGHYLWHGIEIYCAGGATKKGLMRLPTWYRIWTELKRIKRKQGINVVHSLWLTECTLIGQKFAKRFNIRQVAYAIGQDVLKTNRYIRLLKFKDMTIIAMSQSIAERFKNLTGESVKGIIMGGVDVAKISTAMVQRTIDIIGVGALTPLKNYSLFLDIITELKKDFPNIKAVLIGKGEQEQTLKEKAIKNGLQNNVQLIGEIAHGEVFSYLSKSKIFLHTSGYEGQSTVMMEALAAGLTVVCFDVGRLHIENKVVVCQGKEEMVMQLKRLLLASLDFKPAVVRIADDMVNDFMKVYEL